MYLVDIMRDRSIAWLTLTFLNLFLPEYRYENTDTEMHLIENYILNINVTSRY